MARAATILRGSRDKNLDEEHRCPRVVAATRSSTPDVSIFVRELPRVCVTTKENIDLFVLAGGELCKCCWFAVLFTPEFSIAANCCPLRLQSYPRNSETCAPKHPSPANVDSACPHLRRTAPPDRSKMILKGKMADTPFTAAAKSAVAVAVVLTATSASAFQLRGPGDIAVPGGQVQTPFEAIEHSGSPLATALGKGVLATTSDEQHDDVLSTALGPSTARKTVDQIFNQQAWLYGSSTAERTIEKIFDDQVWVGVRQSGSSGAVQDRQEQEQYWQKHSSTGHVRNLPAPRRLALADEEAKKSLRGRGNKNNNLSDDPDPLAATLDCVWEYCQNRVQPKSALFGWLTGWGTANPKYNWDPWTNPSQVGPDDERAGRKGMNWNNVYSLQICRNDP